MFFPVAQNFSTAAQHHPAEPRPILVVAVDDHGDRGILGDVPQALERRGRPSLRLFVDGDVERALEDREADRHHMGNRAPIGGGEVRDALLRQEPALVVRQHGSSFAATLSRGWAQGRQVPSARRVEMRETVTAITAPRRAMWKDDDHGEPWCLTHQPEGSPGSPTETSLTPPRRGFSFAVAAGSNAVISTSAAPRPSAATG